MMIGRSKGAHLLAAGALRRQSRTPEPPIDPPTVAELPPCHVCGHDFDACTCDVVPRDVSSDDAADERYWQAVDRAYDRARGK